tara:strand:- start:120 stop:995 length:876 start_codon:yes stop_codon:yes gene_type:complete
MMRWAEVKRRLDDIGAVPATLGGVLGAPSILSLLQSTYEARDLSAPFQAIVDGYNQGIASAAAIIEPALVPVVTWIGRLFGWDVDLHAHWRHLFVLCTIYLFAQIRIRRTEKGGLKNWTDLPIEMLFALIGCLAAGMIAPKGGWWAQGLIAAWPLSMIWFGQASANIVGHEFARTFAGFERGKPLSYTLGYVAAGSALALGSAGKDLLIVVPPYFIIGFVLGAALSFVPVIGAGAGVAALAVFAITAGIHFLRVGARQDQRYMTRLGLTMLGGYAAAAVVYGIDIVLKLAA